MPETYLASSSFAVDGVPYGRSTTGSADGVNKKSPAVPAAQAGVLTTRTDNDTGSVTMDSAGHTVATGNRLDVYWTGGKRRGMVVGTVSGTTVPIDGGAGDNLPLAATALKVAVPVEEELTFTGNNAKGAGAKVEAPTAGVRGQAVFAQANGTEVKLADVQSGSASVAAVEYSWDTDSGAVNPFAGVSVGKVFFSHDDATGARTMRAAVAYN